MKLLLDTHAFLWHVGGDPQLSADATALLTDPANELFLSAATLWEIAIKSGLKKLILSAPYLAFMARAIAGYGLIVMPAPLDDCAVYEQLPFPDARLRDPFDRMIVVHALRHGFSVVSADAALDGYGPLRLW